MSTVFHNKDPVSESLKLFKWLIAPLSPTSFFKQYWEVKALHIQHNSAYYFSDILTTAKLDSIFRDSDVLARESSPNLRHDDIGKPFMEVTLNAGDMLYFPRGTIHEGRTDPECHSFHITVSVYQHNSFADLLEYALPEALKKASFDNVHFRKGLPLNYLKHTGYVNKNILSEERLNIMAEIQKLFDSLRDYIDIDKAADQLGRRFMYDSMPPVLSKQEIFHTSKYDGDIMKEGKIFNRAEFDMDTEVRLLRYFCVRLVIDEECSKLYYNTENAKMYHGEEEQVLVIEFNLIPTIEMLQSTYPKFTNIKSLVVNNNSNIETIQLVSDLWERGLLITNNSVTTVIGD
ncbi:unnamed protein product [Diabrotica balteata]|uniref:Bifunctional lysine-specific demethylase and histidyl-hydroxylase n=1 Tax=Diabrotica balteata TaxID=107213 RepID=A0A9N9SXD1_DIABA|nr:unnamed protein product [Diabrotica balteata]